MIFIFNTSCILDSSSTFSAVRKSIISILFSKPFTSKKTQKALEGTRTF